MEDKEIIALYFERNVEAITRTTSKYGSKLQRLAEQLLGCKEDAAECVNDTLLKAWNLIPPERPIYFYAFLAKLCRNQALDRLDYYNAKKRKSVLVELTKEMEACIPDKRREEQAKEQELQNILHSFLSRLPKEKRAIFLRRYWFGDSCKEIARSFGFSENRVKVTLHRIRKDLKKYLEKEGVWV